MQIKKELGQIPADTVIQYQEDMIVKPKVKIEPMEEETVAETPEKTETKETVVVKQEEVDVKPEIKEADTQPDPVPQETVTPVTVKEEVSEDNS